MSYRNFTETEIKAINRFSLHLFSLYRVEMRDWKINNDGDLTIKLIYETSQYNFSDNIYVSRKNRMTLKNIVKEFRNDCNYHISKLTNPFEEEDYDVNNDPMYWEGDDSLGNSDYDIYKE